MPRTPAAGRLEIVDDGTEAEDAWRQRSRGRAAAAAAASARGGGASGLNYSVILVDDEEEEQEDDEPGRLSDDYEMSAATQQETPMPSRPGHDRFGSGNRGRSRASPPRPAEHDEEDDDSLPSQLLLSSPKPGLAAAGQAASSRFARPPAAAARNTEPVLLVDDDTPSQPTPPRAKRASSSKPSCDDTASDDSDLPATGLAVNGFRQSRPAVNEAGNKRTLSARRSGGAGRSALYESGDDLDEHIASGNTDSARFAAGHSQQTRRGPPNYNMQLADLYDDDDGGDNGDEEDAEQAAFARGLQTYTVNRKMAAVAAAAAAATAPSRAAAGRLPSLLDDGCSQDTELVDDDAAASSDFLGAAFLRTTTTSLSRQTSTSSKADERRIRQERLREEKRVAKEQRRAETERRKQEALARKDEEVRRRALQREITPTQDPQRMMRSLVCLLDEDILKAKKYEALKVLIESLGAGVEAVPRVADGGRTFKGLIRFERHRKELIEDQNALREVVEMENDIVLLIEGSDFVRRVETRTLISYVQELQANFPPPCRLTFIINGLKNAIKKPVPKSAVSVDMRTGQVQLPPMASATDIERVLVWLELHAGIYVHVPNMVKDTLEEIVHLVKAVATRFKAVSHVDSSLRIFDDGAKKVKLDVATLSNSAELFASQLACFPRIAEKQAAAIAAQYAHPAALVATAASNTYALSRIQVADRSNVIGPSTARLLVNFYQCEDPDTTISQLKVG